MFKGGIAGMMQKAQRMQKEMEKAQEALADITVTGESGAGLVKIEMSCRHVVRAIRIDDSLMSDDKEMLEDLLGAAFNDALAKVEQTSSEKMSEVTGGLGLPAGMKIPGF
ncbi:nucleoid-associated protein [Ignatzschineria indica]|uniref:Nucleoid-associated protein DC082_00040 n=1 Tax=Ignatzschineria indica TaxID=472583 RepID=A0A2U2APY7_9GAMM|nr:MULTISPECIES: YbaB/EbfC family nucleoid-associated protein [Ignatzschineria]MDM1545611.1 YbaB/EbfC family nucleoid-associated protein [Ignatzschineria indica]OYQ77445.1 YbaB/EbfC family nucleoid-associated protein [Ignatzschineria sp. F8392]PWD85558.1 YbaB/EbfC family nucleoid-associated protein [Ignatzschineria indica]GGZ88438.1 nucleoid-associated protein [Ignatzschineria indica]